MHALKEKVWMCVWLDFVSHKIREVYVLGLSKVGLVLSISVTFNPMQL
jgi:hypothetical protein